MNVELNEKFGVQLNDRTATLVVMLDLYDAYVNSPDNIHDRHINLGRKKVKYPLFASEALECKDSSDCPIIKVGKKFKLKMVVVSSLILLSQKMKRSQKCWSFLQHF